MSAEQGQAVTHPAWCDPGECTAPAVRPTEYTRETKGEHRSMPIPGMHAKGMVAYLVQAVTPWECAPYLRIEGGELSFCEAFPVDVSSPLLLLMRQQAAEEEKRWPSLVPPLDDAARRA